MSGIIQIDRFTRQKQTVSGTFSPNDLPRLADFLAGLEGEIHYTLAGSVLMDRVGSQKRRIKCIISGWFLLADPVTLKPLRHPLEIDSNLILVSSEEELPPLEMESDDEDYVVCGNELNIVERVEEEILLDLPAAFGAQNEPAATARSPVKAGRESPAATQKISPFAKLAELKKK